MSKEHSRQQGSSTATNVADERSPKDAHTVKDATIKTLEVSVAALKESNDRLRERMQEEWRMPRIAFGLVIALFGLNIAGNFATQYANLSGTNTLNSSLQEEIKRNEVRRKEITDELAKLKGQFETLAADYKHSIERAESNLNEALDVQSAAEQIASLVALGHGGGAVQHDGQLQAARN